ncbi:MAG: Hpt domain-containing protein [Cyclobacteriaceae bacterium]
MQFEVISLAKLKDFELGEDFLKEMVSTYIEEIPMYLRMVQDSYEKADLETLKRNLHTLKSHSNTLGMADVTEKLRYWENGLPKKSLEGFNEDFDFIQTRCSEAVRELKALEQEGI